jgi:hypothetical protein
MHSIRTIASFAVTFVLVGACSPAASVGNPAVSAASIVSPSVATTPSEPTATPSASAEASVDLAHPVGIIAIGHSGLTGEGACPTDSWATGTDPQVDSVYLRMVAAVPETEGHVSNTAVGGAPASTLSGQARAALATVPAPALAIIQTLDSDIQCNAANVTEVGASVADVLAVINGASPNTKILIVGQLGRPSASFVKDLVSHDPTAKTDLTGNDECTFFDASGALHEAGFARLTEAIDAYEAETTRVCAAVPNCVTDGGVRRTWVDKIDLFSADYNHLNKQGQTAEAKLIWPVVERLLGG